MQKNHSCFFRNYSKHVIEVCNFGHPLKGTSIIDNLSTSVTQSKSNIENISFETSINAKQSGVITFLYTACA